MFDIGFWELALIGVVSLLVIGPQRLPGVVRITGFWLGKTRRMVASVKQEIKEELYAEEMRQSLLENSPKEELQDFMKDVSKGLGDSIEIPASGSGNPRPESLKEDRTSSNPKSEDDGPGIPS